MSQNKSPESSSSPSWEPLQQTSSRIITNRLGEHGILKIGAFGTCGDPKNPEYTSWRREHLFSELNAIGLDEEHVFNPEVDEWTPEMAPLEGIHLSRDEVLTVAITNTTESTASIMEAGFAAYGGILRGQDVFIYIENNDKSPEPTKVARTLAKSTLEAIESQFPLFRIENSLEWLARGAGMSLKDKIRMRNSAMHDDKSFVLPSIPTDLTPEIFLSGTSGKEKPEWMRAVQDVAARYGVTMDDSYRHDWNRYHADEELIHKTSNAVQLIGITKETTSFGALAELGPRIMYGDLAGQSVGIFIEKHDSDPKSATNRARTLAREHLDRLRADFTDLPVFIAQNLEQLALFGMSEYFKKQQEDKKF